MGRGKGFASPLSLSRGPSRFKLVTSRTCLALALTSLEASEEEAAHGQIVVAELANQRARFALVM